MKAEAAMDSYSLSLSDFQRKNILDRMEALKMTKSLAVQGVKTTREIMDFDPNRFCKTKLFKDVAEDLWTALGCKDKLTKKFIEITLLTVKVFDRKIARGLKSQDETHDDTLGDRAMYALIALMCQWGWWPGVKYQEKW